MSRILAFHLYDRSGLPKSNALHKRGATNWTLEEYEQLSLHVLEPEKFPDPRPNIVPVTIEWVDAEAERLKNEVRIRMRWLGRNPDQPLETIFSTYDRQIQKIEESQSRFCLFLARLEIHFLRDTLQVFTRDDIITRRMRADHLLERAIDMKKMPSRSKRIQSLDKASECAAQRLGTQRTSSRGPALILTMPMRLQIQDEICKAAPATVLIMRPQL